MNWVTSWISLNWIWQQCAATSTLIWIIRFRQFIFRFGFNICYALSLFGNNFFLFFCSLLFFYMIVLFFHCCTLKTIKTVNEWAKKKDRRKKNLVKNELHVNLCHKSKEEICLFRLWFHRFVVKTHLQRKRR